MPGESMQLRDLVRGSEPVRVSEKLGSQELRQWDRVATRVTTLCASAMTSGTLMPFDYDTSEALLASLRKVGTKAPREVAKVAQEFGIETDAKALAGMMAPNPLHLVISEGDPLEFIILPFPLLAGVKPEQIRTALATAPALRQEDPGSWNRLDAPGSAPQTAPRRGKAQTFFSTLEDRTLVPGTWYRRTVACHWR